MKRLAVAADMLMLFAALAGCAGSQQPNATVPASTAAVTASSALTISPVPFVTVQEGRFRLDNQPLAFAGVNFWQAMNLASDGPGGDREQLLAELDRLQALGVTNLRIMASSEGPNTEPQRMIPALMTAPGEYDAAVLDGLDFLLAEMGRRGMRAVMTLNNFWFWSGGMAQYVAWADGNAIPYPGDWGAFMAYAAQFYACQQCQTWYRDHIETLINRTNPYTGLAYRDDPTIFAWELANEPRRYTDAWIDDTAAFIKSLDPNHLVTTGSEGTPPWEQQDFRSAHDGPDIDYGTVHIWPQNWGWYDPVSPSTYAAGENEARQYLLDHAAAAAELGKPLVLEEFGLARDHEPLGDPLDPASSTTFRDRFLAAMFAEVEASVASGGALAGDNLWAWSGAARPGDPWVGDPPHELAGWYSVYDSDDSTLAVIAAHAAALAGSEQPATAASPQLEPVKVQSMKNLIPLPVSVTETGATFTLLDGATIFVQPSSDEMLQIGRTLAQALNAATGVDLRVEPLTGEPAPGSILLTTSDADASLGQEGYGLTISPELVTLAAPQPAGIFYGMETLRQMLPAASDTAAAPPAGWLLPTGVIRDQPRFAWRGMMLDVARHFPAGGVEEVKHLIDLMALYKLNTLHLHLTDDQGWRLMIESWPKLAEYGGSTAVGGGAGGYYTQAEYSELVAYARSRYIDIVPEIDTPGHTNAALASYPELNCDGVAPALYTGTEVGFSSLCIDKEITYEFLDDVIGELAALTPGPYIHVGGDEAHSTPAEDYRRFIERVQQIVQAHSKQMLGWAEIAQSDLSPGTVVQHWQGDFGSRAATQGVKVIMSPADRSYLDMKYDDSTELGLNWAGNVDVERAYSWDPATLLPGVGEDAVLGVEAPLWTETLDNIDDLEYMLFPRLLGLAEIGWSPAEGRSWDEYRERLASHGPRLEALGVNFHRAPEVPWE